MRDSNPRSDRSLTCFRGRLLQPLGQLTLDRQISYKFLKYQSCWGNAFALCPLQKSRSIAPAYFAPEAGLEPATLWLTVRCSNQLSYSGIYVSRTSFRFGTANVLQKFLCANFLRYFYENFASFSVLTCHFIVAAREIGIGSGLSLLPRSTTLVATYVAGGPFSEVMVDSRGVTFIKNELFLLYSQVII